MSHCFVGPELGKRPTTTTRGEPKVISSVALLLRNSAAKSIGCRSSCRNPTSFCLSHTPSPCFSFTFSNCLPNTQQFVQIERAYKFNCMFRSLNAADPLAQCKLSYRHRYLSILFACANHLYKLWLLFPPSLFDSCLIAAS